MSKKKSNIEKKDSIKQYIDLLYMTPSQVSAKEIAALLSNYHDLKIELWDEMNVLELNLSNNNSVDFEPLNLPFHNPSDAAFAKNRNIQTVFAIGVEQNDLTNVLPYFEKIIEMYSGFICADSEDFQPVYAGSSDKTLR
ncbi:hypothetical protein I5677_13290 [Mobilitalea sibirica]|uniref:Uncharacterized protein n=1 Tax=Mobilitalea sibirica TaxID=1462919 RepID=A0A8J7KTY3_9FIRM|nr:hypothetical protein [Mobilitalea sibirica]MBH1941871.1 hypothetical protein [Mobilitalea sibirica]